MTTVINNTNNTPAVFTKFRKSTDGKRIEMTPQFMEEYRAACYEQLDQWVRGTSTHNTVAGECCPDFSCCDTSAKWPEDKRILFARSSDKDRSAMIIQHMKSITSRN